MMSTELGTTKPQLSNIEGLRRAVEESPFDAVVALSPHNFPYVAGCFVGTQTSVPLRLAMAIWCKGDDEPILLVCNIETPLVRRESWVKDIREYVEFKTSPIQALADILREKGLERGKIGVELTHLMACYYLELREWLPHAEIGTSEEVFNRVMAVKTPAEIALLARAADLTLRALLATYASSQEGDVERDLVSKLGANMLACGADSPAFLYMGCGPNAGVAHPPPSDYRLKQGDTIKTDCGALFSGYRSDVARTAVVGPPNDEQRRIWEALIKTHTDSIALVRAGNRACDVYNGTKAAAEKHGFPWMMPHQGHSIGIPTHERPILQPFEEWELVPNMCFCVETRVRWASKTGYNVEDLVQVTEKGPIVHTRFFPGEWLFQI